MMFYLHLKKRLKMYFTIYLGFLRGKKITLKTHKKLHVSNLKHWALRGYAQIVCQVCIPT